MRKVVGWTFILLGLMACSEEKKDQSADQDSSEKVEVIKTAEKDTSFSYQQFNYDTLVTVDTLQVEEQAYMITLSTYSLNDSAIVRRLRDKPDDKMYVEMGHQTNTHILFQKDSTIVEKSVDRRDFEPFLHKGFYKECDLVNTKVGAVYNNRVSFYSDFRVPQTEFLWRVRYYYAIENDSTINDLELIDVKYVD